MSSLELSIIVVAYNMVRELPRTLLSLSPLMQRHVGQIGYEVIVVDNGSDIPVSPTLLADVGLDGRVIRIDDASPSPSRAVNLGLEHAAGSVCGVFIDGARIASPGIVKSAVEATRFSDRAVVSTLGFHLGPDVQMKSIHHGYDRNVEDQLLTSVDWTANGYRLFAISEFAGSSANGWFQPISESNALFMSSTLWAELGGYCELFASPGGGLVNQDTYKRACESDTDLIIVLGEGTFHQVHGGVATNSFSPPDTDWHREYAEIRGQEFTSPNVRCRYFGETIGPASDFLLRSLEMLRIQRQAIGK